MSRKYHSPKDYLDAAQSPETLTSGLEYLAKSVYDFVKLAVIRNPNVTGDVLASLIPAKIGTWNEQEIAFALAENPRTPSETLAVLAVRLLPVLNNERNNDFGFKAGVSICVNQNTPLESIKTILSSNKVATQIRRTIARETKRRDVLELLSQDISEAVRKRASKKLDGLAQE